MLRSIDTATAVATVATALTIACGWPQVRRLRRTGNAAGVSLSTTALSVASELGWLVYLTGQRLWSALPEAALTMVVSIVLTIALVRSGANWALGVSAAVTWGLVLLVARVAGGPPAIAALLSVTYVVQLVPAVWTAWRAWCPSGVSAAAWAVRFTQSALWGVYGFIRDDPPLVTLGATGSVASAAVLARLVVTRQRRSAAGADRARRPGITADPPGIGIWCSPVHRFDQRRPPEWRNTSS